jgi:hypothetical protein
MMMMVRRRKEERSDGARGGRLDEDKGRSVTNQRERMHTKNNKHNKQTAQRHSNARLP